MGKVYLIGAGPGDPELLTLKGLKAIQTSDVILYDRLINNELLNYARPDAELIYCGKLPNYHAMKQETINYFLWTFACKGKVVSRLKGGDPFIFGRGGEEATYISKRGIAFEIVPGITSGASVPAYAGVPLTYRGISSSVAFITGHHQDDQYPDRWKHLALAVDTIVVYMGVKRLPLICHRLVENGKPETTPVTVIYQGTKEEQQTVIGTLSSIHDQVEEANIRNPSMIVIGEVGALHESLNWFEASNDDSSDRKRVNRHAL